MRDTLLAGRFRFGDRVGRGGIAEVWAALDERMQRQVAVKLVQPPPSVEDEETRARFSREVQSAGKLSHQNIVTVHDWGETIVGGRQTLYLIMELVAGRSLRDVLKEGAPHWTHAASWGLQIAQALHAAHSSQVVHRDIKPANVLLAPDGTAKVLDFGVAKFVGDTVQDSERITAAGTLLGSPPYMSPEQALGYRTVDQRSDLYSLGCLLYHALTGRPPFIAENPLAVLRMQTDDEPTAPAQLVDGIPRGLNDLVMSLLRKNRRSRPADAKEVYELLCDVVVRHGVLPPTAERPPCRPPGHTGDLAGRIIEEAERQAQEILDEARARANRVRGRHGSAPVDHSVPPPQLNASADAASVLIHPFDLAWHGYDRDEVDVYLRRFRTHGRQAVSRNPAFNVVLRGYNRRQVNACLRMAWAADDRAMPEPPGFQPFWFAVPVPRPLFGEDDPDGDPITELAPGLWYLALRQRDEALIVRSPYGSTGLLRDTSDLQRDWPDQDTMSFPRKPRKARAKRTSA